MEETVLSGRGQQVAGLADLLGGHRRRPTEAHAAATGGVALVGALDDQLADDYLDKSGRASGCGMLRVSTNESIVLVVVAPFSDGDHAVSWGRLLGGGCRGERPTGS